MPTILPAVLVAQVRCIGANVKSVRSSSICLSLKETDEGVNWIVSIPLCTCNKLIKLNRLYTTYKWHLQIYNWLINQYVSALFGHHQAYKQTVLIDPLTPNDLCSGRTAPLTYERWILYIYSTNTGNEYFKHGIYSSFFFSLQNAVCFIILTYLVPVLFTFYIQGVLK